MHKPNETSSLEAFTRGEISRRQLLRGLALGTGAAGIAAGVSGFAPSASAATPLTAVWVSHYTYVAPDLAKTRDWYQEVFGMQIGHQDAETAHMWYGDKGGDTLMIIRQAESGETAPRIERFAFTLADFDKKRVESELKKRGLQPVSEDRSLWFKDPDGNEIGVAGKGYMKRPSAPATKPALWKAVSANHIVVLSENYRKLGDWYKELFALRETSDAGRDVYQWFGDTVWIPTAVRKGQQTSPQLKTLDHVALTIEDYKSADVEAELKRRKLIKPDAKVAGSLGINCVDLNGFKSQVCDKQLVPDSEAKRHPKAS